MSCPQYPVFYLMQSHFTEMTKSVQNENGMTKSMSLINRWYWNASIKKWQNDIDFGQLWCRENLVFSYRPKRTIVTFSTGTRPPGRSLLFLRTPHISVFTIFQRKYKYPLNILWYEAKPLLLSFNPIVFHPCNKGRYTKSPDKSYMVVGIYRYI